MKLVFVIVIELGFLTIQEKVKIIRQYLLLEK